MNEPLFNHGFEPQNLHNKRKPSLFLFMTNSISYNKSVLLFLIPFLII